MSNRVPVTDYDEAVLLTQAGLLYWNPPNMGMDHADKSGMNVECSDVTNRRWLRDGYFFVLVEE